MGYHLILDPGLCLPAIAIAQARQAGILDKGILSEFIQHRASNI
jgi:hypothetical protein